MATLRELIIKVSANSQSFQTEIARASRMGADYYKTMQNGGRQAAAASRDTRRAIAELTGQLDSAKSSALGLAGAFAGAFATGHLISLADEWNSVNARLKQASQSTDDFSNSQRLLMDISQKTGTSFSDNANLFSRSAASMREFGYDSAQVLDITEAISTGLKLSGANAQESSSVITQFSQALAQGVLRGEEFNSVNENGDRVIRALAAGMGVARKDLKSMADQGQLTIDKVVPALISQLGKLRSEFGELPQTVSSSTTKVENAFMQWVGGANEASGATRTLTGILDGVANNIDAVATAAGVLVAVGAARYFGNMALSARSATVDIINTAKSEVALAEAQVRGTQISTARARAAVYRAQKALEAARGTDAQIAAEKRLAAAQGSLSRNITARASAQSALNSVTSVGSRLLGGALGLVGGIPGLVLLGAGAWYTMYQNQEQARLSAQDYAKTIDQVREKTKLMSLPEAADSEGKTRKALDEQNRLIDEQRIKVRNLQRDVETLNKARNQYQGMLDDSDLIDGITTATASLAVEQSRLNQMQEKAQQIQQVLDGLENRRVILIRQQAAEQNRAYQSLIMMNGQHTEFNRLLGLGNNLLMARQGLVNAPMRIPQADLTSQQTNALEKSRRDLALSKLKGEAKELARLGFAADDLGLTNDPQHQTGRQELINNGIAEWRNNESNKPARKAPKSEELKAAEKTEDVYKRLIKQQEEQIALGSQNTELAKVKYQVTQGELASLEQAKKETLLHNAALIDQKNIAEQLKTFREGLADSNAAARDRGDIDFLGAGMGDKARDRMKEMADIRTDFLKQQRDLQRDFSKGQISEDLYKQQTEALQAALTERLQIQEDYNKKTDEQQSDWRAGISDSLLNYADQAADLSSMAATATSEILDATTNSISNNLTSVLTGATSFKEGMSNIFSSLGETVIKTLIQMATQALITKAIMASFGGGAGGMFGSLLGGGGGGGSTGTAIQSAGANLSFNALGGVYDSPSLSAYSGGVYSTPQYFAFAKGAGVFGEAGPEAIMPLTRSADGSLGVKAVGRESPAVQDAVRQQQERQLLSTGDINVNYHLTGKPDDVMMQTLDVHGRRLAKQIKSELTSDVNNPQNAFGRALYSNLQPKKPR
ncbi:phage tail tape measure protein [Klebsiella michiganensis]|nr:MULTISPECIES: phage tail tape measure protein [Klebsiella]MBX4646416.1 phage tail tape measure protein [Klebsiella michiganensis]MBZ7436633.1 phage tail tape measure protein [Klebsiella michiganensis]MDL4449842.1 phage tail tape measure protein [Klebsiella michiganensis]MDV0360819.1 phage tail tape measure protein [Klebsiella michiganensis]MEC5788490.1 phage tail tape measure protein [Klebsiella michiganensis]